MQKWPLTFNSAGHNPANFDFTVDIWDKCILSLSSLWIFRLSLVCTVTHSIVFSPVFRLRKAAEVILFWCIGIALAYCWSIRGQFYKVIYLVFPFLLTILHLFSIFISLYKIIGTDGKTLTAYFKLSWTEDGLKPPEKPLTWPVSWILDSQSSGQQTRWIAALHTRRKETAAI